MIRQEFKQQENRNGRNGSLTSWDSKAVESFKKFYYLYSQFKQKVYLEKEDILFLLSCYNGIREGYEKRKALIRFLARQFRLMGYPQENKNNRFEQQRGYIELESGLIVLNFGFNESRINKALFNDYFKINFFKEENKAHNNPIIEEKKESNNKPLSKNSHLSRIAEFMEKHKEDLDIYDNSYNQDLKGGWE